MVNASSDDFERYHDRIASEIELLLEQADTAERQTASNIYQTFTARPEAAAAAARQLSLPETAD